MIDSLVLRGAAIHDHLHTETIAHLKQPWELKKNIGFLCNCFAVFHDVDFFHLFRGDAR